MFSSKKFIILSIVMLMILVPMNTWATFSIYPYALDFDANSNKRIVSIRVANTTNEPKTFRISLVDQRQKSDGSFEQVPADGTVLNSAKSFMTYSPRQFELGPREAQTVNVSRKPVGDLPDGDYVTHLKIQEVATPKPRESKKKTEKGMDVSIKLHYSLIVPVYLKKGESTGTVDIIAVKLTENAKKEQFAEVKMTKKGEKYFRGRLEIMNNGNLVGMVKNIRIYPDVSERIASVQLMKDTPNLSGKDVKVLYIDDADNVIAKNSFKP